MQFLIKTIVSALIIATVSLVSKKSPTIGAIIVSLPLTSILAIIWLFKDTQDSQQVIDLSNSIFWIVIPSLVFFLALSFFMKQGMKFHWSMISSSVITIIGYNLYIFILRRIGIGI